MTEFWITSPDLKKDFVAGLRAGVKRVKDKEIKELLAKSSNELDPPPPPKKKEGSENVGKAEV
jgi:hypothetical protein